jgi:signal transduction histidine kinase
MLGLGLVVGIIALLSAGTLYGLEKFRATIRSIDYKQPELEKAQKLKEVVNDLKTRADSAQGNQEGPGVVLRYMQSAKDALAAYEKQLGETLVHGRDPENGENEKKDVDGLRDGLLKLEIALKRAGAPQVDALQPSQQVFDDSEVADAYANVQRTCGDLCSDINANVFRQSTQVKEIYKTCIWIVGSTSVVGVLLLCALLRSFYCWVFFPIRDLQQGAGRVAQGDFEHRIEVHSGDEMQDLAIAFNDMTGRLREMYRDLARQVNDRSRQLVRSERLASVGFLAAGVAHEINNPLASIAFCSEALEGRLSAVLAKYPGDKTTVTKYLKMIQEEAFRCKAITQRLLEFSRGGERRREPADLVDIVQGVLDVVQHLQNCKGKRIIFEPAGRLTAWVNAQEIKSVILNLVVNALDSMDDGGTLTITLCERGRMAEIEFTDTGCGMSAEVLENIFEPFFTRSRTGKGTGLGLSISHRVINQHGGEIEAASPGLDQGSTFTVRLPLQPAEPSKEEALGHVAA